ncbi:peptidylprolyl isomerase [Endothiovibrio diazotrophicus]
MNRIAVLAAGLLLALTSTAQAANPRVELTTSLGPIVLELYPAKAPKTVENFLGYVKSGFYEGTLFHRVIRGFMIQGGGLTEQMEKKTTRAPIANEADNGLSNERGTIAMARTGDPDSATSQFFINTVTNAALDFKNKTPRGWGYCVFGRVVDGMETVTAIESRPTANRNYRSDVPVEPVFIEKARLIGEEPAETEATGNEEGRNGQD